MFYLTLLCLILPIPKSCISAEVGKGTRGVSSFDTDGGDDGLRGASALIASGSHSHSISVLPHHMVRKEIEAHYRVGIK